MPAASRGRRIAAIAVSVAVHVVVLTALALHAPTLFIPNEPGGPPEPIIPVLLMPRLPPPSPSAGVKPGPIRLHRRQLRFMPPVLPVKPLAVPEPPAPAPVQRPAVFRPAPLPEGPKQQLQATLRRSPIGCANAEAAGLSRDEREACEEQLGKGAESAPFNGLGLGGAKQTALDRAGARKDAERRYKEAPPPAGLNDPTGSSGQPWQVRPGPH